MSIDMTIKATRALIQQNQNTPPTGHDYYPVAYVVGDKVFLEYLAAGDWVRQTIGVSKIEKLYYREAWNFAHINPKLFKELWNQLAK